MNETIEKAKSHITRQKKIYFFLLVLLGLGILAGILYLVLLKGEDKTFLIEEIKQFFTKMKTLENISYSSSFINSLLTNLFYVVGVWLLGISIIGLPIILFLFLMKGFVLGFSISSIISVYGFKGILGSIAYIFPHQLIIIAVGLLLTFYAMSFSTKLFSSLFLKKEISLKEGMQKYIKILLLSVGGAFLASALEIFVSPFIIQFFTKMI